MSDTGPVRQSWFLNWFLGRGVLYGIAALVYWRLAATTTGMDLLPSVVVGALLTCGCLGTRRGRLACGVAMPFIAFAAFYHSLAWLRPQITAADVHVFLPYWFDRSVFGIGPPGARQSCNEFFATHHSPAVDFVTGLAYLSFLPCVLAFAAYLVAIDRRPDRIARSQRFGWTFLGMNVAGFGTYLTVPVAPPWYVASRGFGPVDPVAHASPAALERWDAMTGIPYFKHFYAHATEVFGALPSMHCAYPMLLILFSWELGRRRLTAGLAAYQLLMCFSAVYLQHHYVTDVISGMLYALGTYALGRLTVLLLSTRVERNVKPGIAWT